MSEISDPNSAEDSTEAGAPEPGPPTLPSNCTVTIVGWENDNAEEAQAFGRGVLAFARMVSRLLDMSRLERIIIALDYAAALASVDRGDGFAPAAPTANEYGQSGAMALNIVRGDELWNVVVISTWLVRHLVDKDHPDHRMAFHVFFHEMVHVADLRLHTSTYPGGWRAARPRDERHGALQALVNPCQSEYSAQRRSAWLLPENGLALLDMLGDAM